MSPVGVRRTPYPRPTFLKRTQGARAASLRILFVCAVSLGPAASLLSADHVEEEEAQLRGLNSAVLQVLSEQLTASPSQQAALRNRAAVVLAERVETLEHLIEEHPRIALSYAFSEDLLTQLAGAFPSSASLLEEQGAWSGVLQQLVINQESLDTQTTVTDLVVGGESYRIYFTDDATGDAKSGDQAVVTGVRAGGSIAGVDTETTGSITAADTCSDTTGDQKIAFLMITFPDTSFPTDVTRPGLLDIGFSAAPASVNTYFIENSYNTASATTASGDVYPLDGSSYLLDPAPDTDPYGCSTAARDYNQIIDAALKKASADGFVPENYHRIAFVHPTPAGVSSCWYGLGSLGCWGARPDNSAPASYSWLHTNAMDSRAEGVRVAAHEVGHNMWLHHSGSLDFGAEPLGPPDPAGGSHGEYGDPYSVMGSSRGHFTPYQKNQLGWYASDSGSYSVQTVDANGTFYLHPAESSATGVKGLKIKRGTDTTNNNWLWIEYRDNSGDFDTTTTTSSDMSGALIRYDDSRNDSGTHRHKTYLLDFHPETGTFGDPALAVGETWSDAYSNLTYTYTQSPVETVTVTALPANKQCLLSWGGACTGLDLATQTSCTVDVSADMGISAGFGKCAGTGGGGGADKPGNGKGRNK